MPQFLRWSISVAAGLLAVGLSQSLVLAAEPKLADSLLFHASFDKQTDADVAAGDAKIYTEIEEGGKVEAGVHRPDVTVVDGGKYGRCLKFGKKQGPVIFFQGEKNMGFSDKNWTGTVSFWLSLDPDKDLEPGYCDPLQITDKSALDASLFVEFSKDHNPRRFRMAVCPEYREWNPKDREWEQIPIPERPVVEIENPPFEHDKWTHVAVTFENFNSGKKDGVAKLYLDGKLAGTVQGWDHHYNWNQPKARIMLGLAYIGRFDDLTVFRRALSAEEIQTLHDLPQGLSSLPR